MCVFSVREGESEYGREGGCDGGNVCEVRRERGERVRGERERERGKKWNWKKGSHDF